MLRKLRNSNRYRKAKDKLIDFVLDKRIEELKIEANKNVLYKIMTCYPIK